MFYEKYIWNNKKKLEDYFINNGDKNLEPLKYLNGYIEKYRIFDEITNINKDSISKIKEDFYFNSLKIVKNKKDELVKNIYLNYLTIIK